MRYLRDVFLWCLKASIKYLLFSVEWKLTRYRSFSGEYLQVNLKWYQHLLTFNTSGYHPKIMNAPAYPWRAVQNWQTRPNHFTLAFSCNNEKIHSYWMLFSISPHNITTHGNVVSYFVINREVDNRLWMQCILTRITINNMVELFPRGYIGSTKINVRLVPEFGQYNKWYFNEKK